MQGMLVIPVDWANCKIDHQLELSPGSPFKFADLEQVTGRDEPDPTMF